MPAPRPTTDMAIPVAAFFRRRPGERPMHREIYVNLPVTDLAASMAFFEAMGYTFNAEFTNEQAACLQLGPRLYAMLLTRPFFEGFSDRPVGDPRAQVQALVCLSCDSREEVDALVAKARAAGAGVPRAPVDHGFMYFHGFTDLDGHVWELAHMPGEAPAA